MQSIIMDGASLSNDRMKYQQDEFDMLKNKHNIKPELVVVQVGNNQASNCYISIKEKRVKMAGCGYRLVSVPEEASTYTLRDIITNLNNDKSVTGILVQKPLPAHIDEEIIDNSIHPLKDVDGFHPINTGLLHSGQIENCLVPCTPMGIMRLLNHYGVKLSGKNVLIFGRSSLVSNPLAKMMMDHNATVTQVHSKTNKDRLDSLIFNADIIVSAMGNTNHDYIDTMRLIGSHMDPVRGEGCSRSDYPIFIDCGTNRDENGKVVGDFPLHEVEIFSSMCTPPTGCVGPMTVSCLIDNIIKACRIQNGLTTTDELE